MGVLKVLAVPRWIEQVAQLLEVDAGLLFRHLLNVIAIWVVVWLAMRAVNLIARRIELAVDDGDDSVLTEAEQRGRTISGLLRSLGKVVLVIIGLLLTLNVFIDIAPILGAAGILGLAVSFGAQSLVKDVISGFFYLLEGQFAVGDVIEVAGKSGVVERMTLRMVMLRDAQGTVHMIPNGQITTVSNMTRKWSRAVVDVGIAYDTDVNKALAIFRDEATAFVADPDWTSQFDGEPDVVGVESLGDNAVTIRTLLRTHAGKQWAVAREFRRRIKQRLEEEGIDIPYPQRTIHVRMPGGMALPATTPEDGLPPAPGRGGAE